MSEFKFPCSKCGSCCKRVGQLKGILPVKEDGSCGHLVNNQCSIYESRPLVCRGRDQFFKNGTYQFMSLRDYYMVQNQLCNLFMDEDGVDVSYRIDLKKEYGDTSPFPMKLSPHDGTHYKVEKVYEK